MSKKNRTRTKNSQQPVAERPAPAKTGIKTQRGWILGLVLAATFFCFANTLTHGFAYDDNTQILQNQLLRDFSNIPTALTKEVWFWRVLQDQDPNKQEGPTTPYYRPMFTIFQMICWHLFESSPAGWHLVNILIHMLAVYLSFLIFERVTGDVRVSAIASLLFAVHPLRSESVAWISGITDPFLAVLLLGSFYFYMRSREEMGRVKYIIAAIGLFLLANFAKEPAVALPIFIFAYELFIINQDRPLLERVKPAVMFSMSFFVLSVFYFVMRYNALGFVFNDIKYTSYLPHQMLMTIPIVIWKYIGLLFWPVNLSIFHLTPIVKSPLSLRFILPVLGLFGLMAALWPLRRSKSTKFGVLWFGVHLLPVLNLNAFAVDFMVQERYVYIPSLGFSLLLAIGLVRIPIEKWIAINNRRTAQVAVVVVICLLFSFKTFAQNRVWNTDDTLWAHGVQVAPDQTMPHYILGMHYIKRQDIKKAIQSLEEFMRLDPNNIVVISNLASAHLVQYESQMSAKMPADRAHVDRAVALCERGLGVSNENAALWDTLGKAYTYETEYKNFARARSCFARALNLQPDLMVANLHMGFTYVKEGDAENGLRYLELARQQQPDFPEIYKFMAYAYLSRGQDREALTHLTRYLELQPNGQDAAMERQRVQQLRGKLQAAAAQS